jgi:hypothetical protein
VVFKVEFFWVCYGEEGFSALAPRCPIFVPSSIGNFPSKHSFIGYLELPLPSAFKE